MASKNMLLTSSTVIIKSTEVGINDFQYSMLTFSLVFAFVHEGEAERSVLPTPSCTKGFFFNFKFLFKNI